MNIQTPVDSFRDSIDASFPYQNRDQALDIIKNATEFGAEGIYAVIFELTYPGGPETEYPDSKTRSEFLDIVTKNFEHPLKKLVINVARSVIGGKELSVDEAVHRMQVIRKYPNEYDPLNIMYFSCDDRGNVADDLFMQIKIEWESTLA
jgi:hypothetical protein